MIWSTVCIHCWSGYLFIQLVIALIFKNCANNVDLNYSDSAFCGPWPPQHCSLLMKVFALHKHVHAMHIFVNPALYSEKLGFTRAYITFHVTAQNLDWGYWLASPQLVWGWVYHVAFVFKLGQEQNNLLISIWNIWLMSHHDDCALASSWPSMSVNDFSAPCILHSLSCHK